MKIAIASAASLAMVAAHGGSHIDCGYPGMSQDECVASGQCAWAAGLPNEPVCFHKVAVPGAGCENSCKANGGVWDPAGAKSDEKMWQKHYACYYPNTAPLPPNTNEAAGHPGTHGDCGWNGIHLTPEKCTDSGKCAYAGGLFNEPICYYKVDCFSYATEDQCKSKKCVWEPNDKGAFWCYHPNTRSLPRVNEPKNCNVNNPDETKRNYSSIWFSDNEAIKKAHTQSMLNSPQAWTAHQDKQQAGEWMMIDFGAWTFVKGLVIQKRAQDIVNDQYVSNVSLSFYSSEETKNAGTPDRAVNDGEAFDLAYDAEGNAEINFDNGVYTRYVKITVNTFNEFVSMRAAGITCV